MGLDMYLHKEIYVGAIYDHRKVTGTIKLSAEGKALRINLKKVESITERVAYWRKANMIHNWFVENVQEGEDDCKRYYVDREQLQQLLDKCKEVRHDFKHAHEILPTTSGFFFGDTSYDQYYLDDINYTVKVLTAELKKKSSHDQSYYYESSW
jgi:hypothetical protein